MDIDIDIDIDREGNESKIGKESMSDTESKTGKESINDTESKMSVEPQKGPEQKMYIVKEFNNEAYDRGLIVLKNCYEECVGWEQQEGGASMGQAYAMLSKIFSPDTKQTFIRIARGTLRTSSGIVADVVSLGAGGDVVVDSVFAVESSMSFMTKTVATMKQLMEAHSLFKQLLKIEVGHHKFIPIVSRLTLDDGFQEFQISFEKILHTHIQHHGSKMLRQMYDNIRQMVDKTTTTIGDWIACLVPDSVGFAGEIATSALNYISNHGFTLIYKLIALMSDKMQKLITNSFKLKKLIHVAVATLKKLLLTLTAEDIANIIPTLEDKVADLIGNPLLKGVVHLSTSGVRFVTKYGLSKVSASGYLPQLIKTPKPQEMLVYVIDKCVVPNIDMGVDLFDQLFPIFLMFTLFIENFLFIEEHHQVRPIPRSILPPIEPVVPASLSSSLPSSHSSSHKSTESKTSQQPKKRATGTPTKRTPTKTPTGTPTGTPIKTPKGTPIKTPKGTPK